MQWGRPLARPDPRSAPIIDGRAAMSKDNCRSGVGVHMRHWLEPLAQDLGYAVRSFRRSPAFMLVALLSLTLGIGATSAIFSVIYGVLIAPYPYAKPE